MSSFGEGLKREREKKKITLDQVAVSTKISLRMLRAIEEEKFDQLPGGIFNKGFVRAYARYLGVDEDKAVEDYLAASAPVAQAPPEDLELRAMAEQKDKERHRQASLKKDFPWGSLAVVLLLVAFGFSIWGVMSGRTNQSTKANGTAPTSPGTPAQTSPTAAATPQLATRATPGAGKTQLASQGQSRTAEGVAADDDGEMEVTTRHLTDPVPVKPTSQTETKAGSFMVLVTAQENSWLTITADGKSIFTGTLIAPGSQLVHASNSIVLRAGNLGGLEIDFNGKRLPPQGTSGEAKTLTFHADGLEVSKPPASSESSGSVASEPPQNR